MPAGSSNIPVIPDHEMLRVIGSGAYGEVWLARTVLGVYRAVKVVRRADLPDDRAYEREFGGLRRYEPVSRGHPGLVQVLHVGRDDNGVLFYYVMELADSVDAVSGFEFQVSSSVAVSTVQPETRNLKPETYQPRTLALDLRSRSPLPVKECVALGLKLTEALAHLHTHKLVHRDIKPSNVIFVKGQPRLADIGLVSALGEPASLVGTPGYIAPEGPGQLTADIYSLGKVLYVAATGQNPEEFPALPSNKAPSRELLELNEVLLRACAERRVDRYQTANEMRRDLERLNRGGSLRGWKASCRRSLRQIRNTPVPTALTAMAAAALLLAAALVGRNRAESESVSSQTRKLEGRIFFDDEFDGVLPSEELWEHRGTSQYSSRADEGRSDYQISQGAGSLLLETRAEHESGWYRRQDAWLDSKMDLKTAGETELEIEFAGSAINGGFWILLSDGKPPEQTFLANTVLSEPLWGNNRHPVAVERRRLRATLVPSAGLALVYDIEPGNSIRSVLNVSELPKWVLRFWLQANSSEGFPADDVRLSLYRVTVRHVPERTRLIVTAHDAASHRPVPQAEILSSAGKALGRANDRGLALLDVPPGRIDLLASAPGYEAASGPAAVTLSLGRYASVDLSLKKSRLGYGDVIESLPVPADFGERVGPFIFANGWLYFILSRRDGSDLFRLDQQSLDRSRIAPLKMERGLVWHRDKLYGVHGWDGAWLFEVSTNGTAKRLHKLPTLWPVGLASDGELLWFAESDNSKNRHGVFAMNAASGSVVHHFKTTDSSLTGLTYGNKHLWFASRDEVYEIDPARATDAGWLEQGRVRKFKGGYMQLTFHEGYLWGYAPDVNRFCKISVDQPAVGAEVFGSR